MDPRFFLPCFHGPRVSHLGHKREEKTRFITCLRTSHSTYKRYVLCCVVLHIILYCIVLNCIVLYCIVLYCIVLYCIVLYCIVCSAICCCQQRLIFLSTLERFISKTSPLTNQRNFFTDRCRHCEPAVDSYERSRCDCSIDSNNGCRFLAWRNVLLVHPYTKLFKKPCIGAVRPCDNVVRFS